MAKRRTAPRRHAEVLGFHPEDPSAVVAAMEAVAAEAAGWVNVSPGEAGVGSARGERAGGARRVPLGIAALFAARPPAVVCSWVPSATGDASVGVSHGRGAGAARRLEAAGVDLPVGWRVRQDRVQGLVVAVPLGEPCAAVLDWMIAATSALAEVTPESPWHAVVHRRRAPGVR